MDKKQRANEKISSIEIGKYYLKVELGKPIKNNRSKILLNSFIESLEETDLWSMLRTVSLEYRKNNIYNLLKSEEIVWHKEKVNVENIILGMINERVNPYLESANYNPLKFRDILRNSENLPDTKEALKEFSSRKIEESEMDYIFTIENNKFRIWDGTHRFISQILSDNIEISGYVGRKMS